MLYNKDWDVKTKDLFTLDNLIAWLETKDPTEVYSFHWPDSCLLGQWARNVDASAFNMRIEGSFVYKVNEEPINLREYDNIACYEPWTFGAALQRAKALRDGSD